MAVEERKLAVLRAIVEDFIATNEPVGSKALADRTTWASRPPRSAMTCQRWRMRA